MNLIADRQKTTASPFETSKRNSRLSNSLKRNISLPSSNIFLILQSQVTNKFYFLHKQVQILTMQNICVLIWTVKEQYKSIYFKLNKTVINNNVYKFNIKYPDFRII